MTELESGLAGHLPELQLIKDAPPQSVLDLTQSRELKDAWEEATKVITERYKKFSAFLPSLDQLALLSEFISVVGDVQTGAVPCAGGAAEEVPTHSW